MLAEGWRTWPYETGGIVLGHDHGTHVAIREVVGPGPQASHARYAFRPDADWQAEQVATAWHTDPTIEYLGDWHTHPGGTTRLSRLDHRTAQAIADAKQARQPAPVMIVLALGQDLTSRVGAARLIDRRLTPLALRTSVASDSAH
jgi:integrative and conjugative element protein (TIGR02256 family)